MVVKRNIIEHLSKELALPFTGSEQDWELEMANINRIDEFISFYKKMNLPKESKYSIMSIILASYEDLLNESNIDKDGRWDEIKILLSVEKDLFKNLLEYWSVGCENENVFTITHLIREL